MKKTIGILLLLLLISSVASATNTVVRNTEHVINDVWNDSADSLQTGSAVVTGVNTLAASVIGTVLDSTSQACRYIIVRPASTNTMPSYVSNSTATANATSGFTLSGDNSDIFYVDNVQDLYVSADIVGEKVTWAAIIN